MRRLAFAVLGVLALGVAAGAAFGGGRVGLTLSTSRSTHISIRSLVTGVTILTAPDSLQVGRTATMTARAVNWKGTVDPAASVLWRSLNPAQLSVLGVGATATITARSAGNACAIAWWNHRAHLYADTACVRVTTAPTYTYTLVGPQADTLGWDASRRYQWKTYVKGGQYTTLSRIGDPSIVFTSSNIDVATVTDADSGRVLVRGTNPGPAYVIASYRGVVDSMPVVVLRNVERIAIAGPDGSFTGASIATGESIQLYAVMWDVKGQVLDVYPADVPPHFPYVPVGRRKDAKYYQRSEVRIALAEQALQHSNFKVSVR